jgi:hypothetical protein
LLLQQETTQIAQEQSRQELDRLRRELEEKAQQRLQQEEAEQSRREAAEQEPLRRKQQELMQGRSIILDALDATSIQAVKEVPFSYLEHISDEWELFLGSGGFGSVYRGVDSDGNFEVAIKALRSDRMTEKDVAEFEDEISVRTPCPLISIR